VHGEGPHWDAETGVLFFVDIDQQRVNKYDPVTSRVTHAQFGEFVRTANFISFLTFSV
jgi:sugar lactone lactonase YvrE